MRKGHARRIRRGRVRRKEGAHTIRYQQLLYFTEIVDRGSFSAAARSLYVSQSALSQSVTGLEKELGAELMHRSRSGVSLTYFGHRVYDDAKVLLSGFRDCEAGWRRMLDERGGIGGQVRIRCNPGAEAYLSETIVPELRTAYPGVELLISASPEMRQGIQSFVKSGCKLGIGVCVSEQWDALRKGAGEAGLVCEPFGVEMAQVLLSARNALAQGESLSREQLGQLDLIWYTFAPPPRFQPLFRGVAAKVPNKESMVRMVSESEWAGVFTPSTIRRELSEFKGRVRLLPVGFRDDAFLSVMRYLIHAPDEALSRPEQCTLALLRHYPYVI